MSGNWNSKMGTQPPSDRATWGQGRGRGRGRGRGSANPQNPSQISARERENASTTRILHSSSGSQLHPTSRASNNAGLVRRRMDLMASVSRSSGLERDGDDLKNHKTQEEYRNFIQEKVELVFNDFPRTVSESESDAKKRKEFQENILILFRKLREGVSSSGRNDHFALETYETSLFLSVLFDSPKQTVGIIPHLLPVRFEEYPKFNSPGGPTIYTVLISLLHHLVEQYPFQSRYHQQLDSTSKEYLLSDSHTRKWLDSLTKALRTRNFTKFSRLSDKSSILSVLESSGDENDSPNTSVFARSRLNLGRRAVLHLLQALRKKSTDLTWNVLRSAYRELTVDQTTTETGTWLSRSLCFQSLLGYEQDIDVEHWLAEKIPLGHVRRKEGVDGRWVVCKIR